MWNLLTLLFLLIGYSFKDLVYSQQTSSSGGCELPTNLRNNRFCSLECDNCFTGKCRFNPGDKVNHLIKVQCEPDHRMAGGKVNQTVLCLKGQWIPSIPNCYKVCQPLKSFAVKFTCSFGNVPVDCSTSWAIPGTNASYKCEPNFVAEQGTDLMCSPEGFWLGTLPKCISGKEAFEKKLNSVCGRSHKIIEMERGEIVEIAGHTIREYPWMAAIGGKRDTNGSYYLPCMGNLISDQYVVSTASCINEIRKYPTYKVHIGDLSLSEAWPQHYEVESTIIHEQYNSVQHSNDIGLIKLKEKVGFNDYIRPICLPPQELSEQSFEEYPVELAAWVDKDNDPIGSKLQRRKFKLMGLEACKLNVSSSFDEFDQITICIRNLEKDPWQVPRGSPLMISQDSRTLLLGMHQWSVYSPEFDADIIVSVSQYTSWMLDRMDF